MTEPLVKWNASYDIGVDEIDGQHRSLVDLLNQVWEGIVRRVDRTRMLKVLDELERYTVAHFTAEELYMWEINFPGFNSHTRMHREFIARIDAEKQAVIAGGDLSLDLLHFLRDWLINHILVQDKAYADYARLASSTDAVGRASQEAEEEAREESLLKRIFRRFQ